MRPRRNASALNLQAFTGNVFSPFKSREADRNARNSGLSDGRGASIPGSCAMSSQAIVIHRDDNVAVALADLSAGETVCGVELRQAVPKGHKLALEDVAVGDNFIKFGFPVGRATQDVLAGEHVHTDKLVTRLGGVKAYEYAPDALGPGPDVSAATFEGYRRADGRVGTRNEIWIINTVGCVNRVAQRIAAIASERFRDRIDGVHAFSHPYGCSQLGDDLVRTRKVLAGLIRHPNAAGVLVIGLGCETNQLPALLAESGIGASERIRAFNSQAVGDELEAGLAEVGKLVEIAAGDRREPVPLSELVVGVKCGGSDGFSGITANPAVGNVTDRLTAAGASVLLTETPEMFGAEQILLNRAADEKVFNDIVDLTNRFKQYFIEHGQPVFENPSPGNKAGGITTLEEKSLGAIQKGGRATVTDVLRYGEPVGRKGLSLLEAPGNDAVSSTALCASGATILLFTTGRGTPLGFPAPTLKVSSNSELALRKPHWIDFDAGRAVDGVATETLGAELLERVVQTASGARTRNENGGRS